MEKKIISVRLSFFFQIFNNDFLGFFFLIYFRQILGVTDENEVNVDDPCSDEFYNYFRQTARNNAQIYEDVFNTLPTNRIRLFTDVEDYTQRPKLVKTDPLAVNIDLILLNRHLRLLFVSKRLMKNVNKFEVLLWNFHWNS